MADQHAARPLPRLRKARESRHLTQAEVAERLAELAWYRDHSRLGISSDMVSKWERGEKRPSRLYRQLLCCFSERHSRSSVSERPLGCQALR